MLPLFRPWMRHANNLIFLYKKSQKKYINHKISILVQGGPVTTTKEHNNGFPSAISITHLTLLKTENTKPLKQKNRITSRILIGTSEKQNWESLIKWLWGDWNTIVKDKVKSKRNSVIASNQKIKSSLIIDFELISQ